MQRIQGKTRRLSTSVVSCLHLRWFALFNNAAGYRFFFFPSFSSSVAGENVSQQLRRISLLLTGERSRLTSKVE